MAVTMAAGEDAGGEREQKVLPSVWRYTTGFEEESMSISPPLPGAGRKMRPRLPEAPAREGVPRESNNPYYNALQQLETAARYLELDPALHEVLKYPERE